MPFLCDLLIFYFEFDLNAFLLHQEDAIVAAVLTETKLLSLRNLGQLIRLDLIGFDPVKICGSIVGWNGVKKREQTDRNMGRQTNTQVDQHIGRQTYRQTHGQTDRFSWRDKLDVAVLVIGK